MADIHPPEIPDFFKECGSCGASDGDNGKSLKRCGGCKLRRYCSTKCQKKDWRTHKHACNAKAGKPSIFPQPNELHANTGIMLTPFPNPYNADDFRCGLSTVEHLSLLSQVSRYSISGPAISLATGLPLRLYQISTGDADPNTYAQILALDCDANSASFGRSQRPDARGPAIVVREDQGLLHVAQIKALVQFCYMIKAKIEDMQTVKDAATFDKHAFAAKHITPVAFKKFFEDTKATQMLNDRQAWDGVDCPVEGV